MDAAGLDGFGDVEVGVLVRDGGQNRVEPGAASLEEFDSELGLSEDVHAAEVADDAEADGQLGVTAQLLEKLVEHQLSRLTNLTDYPLKIQRGVLDF